MKFDERFAKEYKKLNPAQQSAVDAIDGPLMVVAGPGTGKTQLLAMRVANILKNSDASANNILCLTFTESAAANMTERMASIFGPQAYQVSVNTFHGLGSEIINKHGQYFYNGAIFKPADDLTTRRIIEKILSSLPHSNPLASTMNGQFTYLGAVVSAISDIKKAGLMPQEVAEIVQQNLDFSEKIAPDIQTTFADRISKKTIDAAQVLLAKIKSLADHYEQIKFSNEPPLAQIIADTLESALSETVSSNKTTSLTKWKREFVATKDSGELILRDQAKSEKLIAVNDVYSEYLKEMLERSYYDYDDMILRVIHALELFPSLKADLQEHYQYVLVDEFQDTNDGQMRLLHNLTDYDNAPNIMVVGDDDQAIFRFQGADISNIQSFRNKYSGTKTIVLTENYRSNQNILESAGGVSGQIQERLSNIFGFDKTLASNIAKTGQLKQVVATTREHEYANIASLVKEDLTGGTDPADIAVIARRHRDLEGLLPFFNDAEISVSYEKNDNALASEPIVILELLSRIVTAVAETDYQLVDSLLPEMLSYKAWEIEPKVVWEISLAANRDHKYWLESMLAHSEKTKTLAEWLITMSAESRVQPLEKMLDLLFGSDADAAETFQSPLYDYYFADSKLDEAPMSYLEFLSSLGKLRQVIRDYNPDDSGRNLVLGDLIELIDSYREIGKSLVITTKINSDQVNLLTAHKAKGLEFDSVYIINGSSESWGNKSRGRSPLVAFPSNMPFAMTGDSTDEQLRLLFVAMTRAKYNLTVSSHQTAETGKSLLPLEYIADNPDFVPVILPTPDLKNHERQLEIAWHAKLSDTETPATREQLLELLSDKLSRYKLSATDLNNFIDVTSGGPKSFLMRSLLKFPSAKSAAALFGTAMHTTLQRAHTHLTARGDTKPLEDMIGDFETSLREAPLSERDLEFYLQKGVDALRTFYDKRIDSFQPQQIVEYDFHSENITINQVRLTGKIDLIDIDKNSKILVVTDYKTGKSPKTWQGKTDYEKIKLHKYRQQLLLYKLLIEKSNRFRNFSIEKGVLEFVEPVNGEITRLEMTYDQTEIDDFIKLLDAIWKRIISLDLPNTNDFSLDMSGILEFEEFLIK